MKDVILKMLVEWLIKNMTQENVQKLAEYVKNWILPRLRLTKDELIKKLRASAAATPGGLDDHAVTLLDGFLEALLPDNPTHL